MSTNEAGSPPLYQIIDHSSDLMIRVFGRDFLEALANASAAIAGEAVQCPAPREDEERFVRIEGHDDAERAIAFLNEIVYLIYGRGWLPHRVRRLTACSSHGCPTLEATLAGEPLNPSRHIFRHDVKAVTYHEFAIRREDDRTMIQFVCDL